MCCLGYCVSKVRVIVCNQLALLLRFVDKPSQPCSDITRRDSEDILDEGFSNHVESHPARTSTLSDPVLIDIRELLQKKAEREETESVRLRNESEIKYDWTLAALVINRICFIFFTTTLLAVTAVFFFVFHLHH